ADDTTHEDVEMGDDTAHDDVEALVDRLNDLRVDDNVQYNSKFADLVRSVESARGDGEPVERLYDDYVTKSSGQKSINLDSIVLEDTDLESTGLESKDGAPNPKPKPISFVVNAIVPAADVNEHSLKEFIHAVTHDAEGLDDKVAFVFGVNAKDTDVRT